MRDIGGVGAVALPDAVLAAEPHVARFRPWFARRLIERLVEVEVLDALSLLARIEGLQEFRDLVLAETGQR